MPPECSTCGFDNPDAAPVCALCGAPGLGAVPVPEREDGRPVPITAVGEEAAHAAAHALPGREPRPAPLSHVGETAGIAAVSADERLSTRPERLLGRLKLVVEQGLIIGEQYLLAEPEMLIGRADTTAQSYPDIDLGGQDNDYVHRVHARLQFHDLYTRLSVEHLGGANPTLVNNEPVHGGELVELFVGDRLRVGRVVMRVARV
jgi:hypothetical protein